MKKELQMTIKRKGALNTIIADLIGKYNEGEIQLTLSEIVAILKGKKLDYKYTLEKLSILHLGNEIIISEDGENISVIIEERELMPLNENITDEIEELS